MRASVVIAAVLAGILCAAGARAQDKPAAGSPRKVAIVSLIPESLQVGYVGETAFNNFVYFGTVDWWKMSEHLTDTLAAELAKRGGFDFVRIPYDRGALATRARGGYAAQSAVEALKPDLAALGAAHGLDLIFVFVPGYKVSVLCGGGGCAGGYGDTGFGVFSVGARFGPASRNRGDNAYLAMKLHVVEGKSGSSIAEAPVAGYAPVAFNRSNEFTGIPAPMLESWETRIKDLVSKHVPLAVTRLELLNAAPAGPAGDPSTVPALVVDTECCPAQRTLAADLAKGYETAAAREGLKIGGETAKLTVRNLVAGKRGNPFVAPPTGENKIEAVLEFRGNQYFVSDYSRMFGKISDVANSVGELSLEKVHGVVDPSRRREKPPAIPKGPE